METEKKEKKPYEPPTLTVVELDHKFDLLQGSCDFNCDDGEYEDDFSGIPVIIGRRG